MKLSTILALFTLSTIVRGWTALLQPIALSIGAALAAFNLDVEPMLDIQSIKLPNWLFKSKVDDSKEMTPVTNEPLKYGHYDRHDPNRRRRKPQMSAQQERELENYVLNPTRTKHNRARGWFGPEESVKDEDSDALFRERLQRGLGYGNRMSYQEENYIK